MRRQTNSLDLLLLLPLLLLILLVVGNLDSVSSFRNSNKSKSGMLRESAAAHASSLSSSSSLLAVVSSDDGLSVGFLGCGTIASSIARGLAKAHDNENKTNNSISIASLVVSKRSESKSQELANDLSSSSSIDISITESNQAILDACDLIFLTVLPQQASEVLSSLEFDPNKHVLVSLVSTANLQDLVRDSKLDLSRVAKMICLPSISNHEGVALLCCGDTGTAVDATSNNSSHSTTTTTTTTRSFLNDLFASMGGVVCLDTEADLEACMVTTCTMGPLYGTMKNQRDWLLKNTNSLSKADATFLVVKQFAGAVADAAKKLNDTIDNNNDNGADNDHDVLEDLIKEQTPGGLNEQALHNYGTVLGGFANLQEPVSDAILSRIRGETNGSLDAAK